MEDAPPALEAASASAAAAASAPLIPVTILSGFLGAGKTTLLKYILQAQHGKRIAVIENEFGEEVGVESLVAKDGAGDVMDGFYELSNGCVCCSVRSDLVNTLEKLLERRDRFDYILVETTGMADPGKVASIFWVDDELEGRIFLDGIVTLVDAPRLDFHLDHPDTQREAAAQLAYADRVLLNKGDLVQDPDRRRQIEHRARQVNGVASVRWTERSIVDLDDILNIKSFTTSRAEQVEQELHALLVAREQQQRDHDHENCGDERHDHATHTGGMQTTCVRVRDGPLDQDKLERWLGELLWGQDEEEITTGSDAAKHQKLFRVKGVVAVSGEPNKFILQAVHELFEVYASEERWKEGELSEKGGRVTQVVFIGLHLRKDELEAGLRGCVVDDN
ncbi:Cobalamin synthesis protein [Phytophthora cinnamomi]|uniref:Cobalamin synthesis protein n=1 Tax=Phytophthora cinnamomi TaxID=4785 RepID=UPI0035597251|nr:Cobalamin synthesis protein [Phytophthora cinnamomi]